MANEPVYRVTLHLEGGEPVERDECKIVVSAAFRCMFELLADHRVVVRA